MTKILNSHVSIIIIYDIISQSIAKSKLNKNN